MLRGGGFTAGVALLLWADCSSQVRSPGNVRYTGGRSNALEAVVRIARSNRVPLGVVLGVRPLLCGQEQDYDFRGKNVEEALRASLDGTGYVLSSVSGVYRIAAPDPSPGEQKTAVSAFPSFPSSVDTMSGVGALLTGWIQGVVEGAGGFLVDHLSGSGDEHLRFPELRNVTPPQVADVVVRMRGHGFWVMQAYSLSSPPKPGSTQISIFSYHDLQGRNPGVSCIKPTSE